MSNKSLSNHKKSITALSWTHPICERCWLESQEWTPETGIRLPYRLNADESEIHICAYCGYLTFVGIFVRDNPSKVKFPREENNES